MTISITVLLFATAAACGSNTANPSNPDGGSGAPTDDNGFGQSDGGSGGGSGSGGCPIYQARCNGTCAPVANDPKNCGACGVTCPSHQVCAGGGCADDCAPGLTACAGACVDLQNDSANCGQCGNTCATGMGCVAGACVQAVGNTTGSQCTGGGPQIQLGPNTAGCVAQTTFTWGLCSCHSALMTGKLTVDGYDSTKGTYVAGGLGAGIGTNENFGSGAAVNLSGPLWMKGTAGLSVSGSVDIKQEARIGAGVGATGQVTVEEDAFVNGSIVGTFAVKKTLTVPADANLLGNVTYGSVVRAPVDVPTPCACGAKDLLPVKAWVAAAAAKNDDASIGITPDILAGLPNSPARIDLPCGVYYLSSILTTSPVTIAAHGNTALFIGEDILASARISFVVAPTAQFDIIVGGGLMNSNSVVVGSPNFPALSRLYVGSEKGLDFVSDWRIAANVYSPFGANLFAAGYTLYGSVFAGSFNGSGDATIHYDRAVVSGGLCNPGGPTGQTCNSCKDCGNQACNGGTCGSCTSDDQCCAPLRCDTASGQCVQVKSVH